MKMLFRRVNPSILLYFALCLIVFVTISCKENDNPTFSFTQEDHLIQFNGFPVTYELKGTKTEPSPILGRAMNIVISGDYILIAKDMSESYLTIYDKNWNVIRELLPHGTGPNESNKPPTVNKQDFVKSSFIYAFSFPNRLFLYPFEKDNFHLLDSVERLTLHQDMGIPQKMMQLSDSVGIALLADKKGKHTLFKWQDMEAYHFTDFVPAVSSLVVSNRNFYAFNGVMTFFTDHKRWVFANTSFNQLEIMNEEGEVLYEVRNGVLDERAITKDVTKAGFYYYALDVNEHHIFALYLGQDRSKIVQNMLFTAKPEIHVFTTEGLPVARLKLDRLVNDFALNTEGTSIIAIDETNENQPFVIYTLPENLHSSSTIDRQSETKN